ncbi:biotin/lipoyl-binding protein [Alkalibacter rhizosphaerae]|uniref:Biotin/lipoyl-binding protein n=1 Tax=Alkalibacter rhizosphaerae TaxID=2815577 RepID=A0A974XGX5_9FIRM|nr:biotin/lipoyl-binding protein [Alkalibacter rhizosphaerae]QSX08505.1 biotin/lipoyl-binding protein [Alkalibacter rhizosphaerae]
MGILKKTMDLNVKKAIIVILMISLAVMFAACGKEDESQEIKISTQEVKQGNLVVGLYADGRISMPSTPVDFKVSGTLGELHAVVGQTVEQGDVLAVLDKSEFSEAVAAAQRDLNKAKAVYEDAVKSSGYNVATEKIKLDSLYGKLQIPFDDSEWKEAIVAAEEKVKEKTDGLQILTVEYDQAVLDGAEKDILSAMEKSMEEMETGLAAAESSLVTAQKNLDNARSKYDEEMAVLQENYELQKLKYDNLVNSNISVTNAKYSVDVAQAKLEEANENMKNATLVAPVSGKITQISGSAGDFIAGRTATSSSATNTANGFAVITDGSKVRITADVNEGDIGSIELGQTIKANVEAIGLIGLVGKVVEINSLPKIDNSGIVTYTVTGELEESNEQILDGMSVFLSYIKREKENVLLVSNKAIFVEDGKQYVWVQLENEEMEKREILAGLSNGSQSEIVEGLTAGETVVTSGMNP